MLKIESVPNKRFCIEDFIFPEHEGYALHDTLLLLQMGLGNLVDTFNSAYDQLLVLKYHSVTQLGNWWESVGVLVWISSCIT